MIDVPLQSNGGQWWAKRVPADYDLPLPQGIERAVSLRGLPFLASGTTVTLAPRDILLTGRYIRTGDAKVDLTFADEIMDPVTLTNGAELGAALRALALPEPIVRRVRGGSSPLQQVLTACWALRLGWPVLGYRLPFATSRPLGLED